MKAMSFDLAPEKRTPYRISGDLTNTGNAMRIALILQDECFKRQ